MSTYRQVIYMVLDEIKGFSDDFTFTEHHIKFLIDNWRALLLKQRYGNGKHIIPESNYQTLCIELLPIKGDCNTKGMLKSKFPIPFTIMIGNPKVYTESLFGNEINLVSKERFNYAGSSKYSENTIYAVISNDKHLYLKSNNPQFLNLERVVFTGVFNDPSKVASLKCGQDNEENNTSCDPLDSEYPLEDALVPLVISQVVQELSKQETEPTDTTNNANDDIPDKMLLANAALRQRQQSMQRPNATKNNITG